MPLSEMRKSALNLLLGVVHADRQNVAQTNMLVSEEVSSHYRLLAPLSRSLHLFHSPPGNRHALRFRTHSGPRRRRR